MGIDPLDAACQGVPTQMFFPRKGAVGDASAALRVCRRCPIVDACRTWAVDHHEEGIWGGTTDRQRQRIRAKRTGQHGRSRTGTQRKTVAARRRMQDLAGLTVAEAADRLGVSTRTVERHRAALRVMVEGAAS